MGPREPVIRLDRNPDGSGEIYTIVPDGLPIAALEELAAITGENITPGSAVHIGHLDPGQVAGFRQQHAEDRL